MDNQNNENQNISKTQTDSSHLIESILQRDNSRYTDSQKQTIRQQHISNPRNQNIYSSYLSNNAQTQNYDSVQHHKIQVNYLELIHKKELQLKDLQTFLLKQFQEITENKQKHQKIINKIKEINNSLYLIKLYVKNDLLTQMKQSFNKTKQQIINSFNQLIEKTQKATQQKNQTQNKQVNSLRDQIQSLYSQMEQKDQIIKSQKQQIQQLIETIESKNTQNFINISQKSQQNQQKSNENIHIKTQQEQDLQVSFSADKKNRQKILVNTIFMMKSNESIYPQPIDQAERKSLSRQNTQIQHIFQLNRLQTPSENAFQPQNVNEPQNAFEPEHIFQGIAQPKISPKSNSNNNSSNLEEQLSKQISSRNAFYEQQYQQTQSLQRCNTGNGTLNNNDHQSAINKLEIFSQLNGGLNEENQQNMQMRKKHNYEMTQFNNQNLNEEDSYYRDYQRDDKYSQIGYPGNMKQQKICRSMKVTRKSPKGQQQKVQQKNNVSTNKSQSNNLQGKTKINKQHENNSLNSPTTKINLQSETFGKIAVNQSIERKQQKNEKDNPTKKNPTGAVKYLDIEDKQEKMNERQKQIQKQTVSPSSNRKKYRYDYCKQYQDEQMKQISDISAMCNKLATEKYLQKSTYKPQSKNRQINTHKMSAAHKNQSRTNAYKQDTLSSNKNRNRQQFKQRSPQKTIVSHTFLTTTNLNKLINRVPSSSKINQFSKTKNNLTINIDQSPQKQPPKCFISASIDPNPYYKLQNHLHQRSYNEFSPKKMEQQVKYNKTHEKSIKLQSTQSENTITKPLNNDPSLLYRDRKQCIKDKIQLIKRKNIKQSIDKEAQKKKQPQQKQIYAKQYKQNKNSIMENDSQENHLSQRELQRTFNTHSRSHLKQDNKDSISKNKQFQGSQNKVIRNRSVQKTAVREQFRYLNNQQDYENPNQYMRQQSISFSNKKPLSPLNPKYAEGYVFTGDKYEVIAQDYLNNSNYSAKKNLTYSKKNNNNQNENNNVYKPMDKSNVSAKSYIGNNQRGVEQANEQNRILRSTSTSRLNNQPLNNYNLRNQPQFRQNNDRTSKNKQNKQQKLFFKVQQPDFTYSNKKLSNNIYEQLNSVYLPSSGTNNKLKTGQKSYTQDFDKRQGQFIRQRQKITFREQSAFRERSQPQINYLKQDSGNKVLNRHTNSLYMHQASLSRSNIHSNKKHAVSTEYHYQQQKIPEQNYRQHPYMIDSDKRSKRSQNSYLIEEKSNFRRF